MKLTTIAIVVMAPFAALGLCTAIAIARLEWQQRQDRIAHRAWLRK